MSIANLLAIPKNGYGLMSPTVKSLDNIENTHSDVSGIQHSIYVEHLNQKHLESDFESKWDSVLSRSILIERYFRSRPISAIQYNIEYNATHNKAAIDERLKAEIKYSALGHE